MRRPSLDEPVSVVSSKGLLEKQGSGKKTGPSDGGAHMGADRLQGKQAVVFYATKDCSGVLDHKRTPPWDVPGKRPLIHP